MGASVKKKVLVGGHDLKFWNGLQDALTETGRFEFRVDQWLGHQRHDPRQSMALLQWADIIVAEWALHNAVFYAKHKHAHQQLFIRFHLMERDTIYPAAIPLDHVDRIIFVGAHIEREIRQEQGWPNHKTTVIPNMVDSVDFDRPKYKGACFNLGLMGIVPSRKRLDIAVDLLARLNRHDDRWVLRIKGANPSEYDWLWRRHGEPEYYTRLFAQINASHLRTKVVFDPPGQDVPDWFRCVGFILSPSDFESFHMAVAEGICSGTLPIVWNWEGAGEIYPFLTPVASVDDAVRSVTTLMSPESAAQMAACGRAYARKHFDCNVVRDQWAALLLGHFPPSTHVNQPSFDQQFLRPTSLKISAAILGWPDTFSDKGKPFVLGIMDEFTTDCFKQDVNLIQPRPDNWQGLAEKYLPLLIFIESAWKGNFGSWQYRVGQYTNRPGNEVAQLAAYGRKQGIPVVFWNKEDPVHHDKFMDSARQADVIFTTDASMLASYRQATGNSKVFALPFGAQPELHNPSPLEGRTGKACFAGSWYGGRHAARGEAMEWLLKVARPLGLEIYDRNHGTGMFPFPQEYSDCIRGSLPYTALCQKYGHYRVFLNVNSVTDSPTMFSRRVFELLACGTPVVSTYARGIEELLGTSAVWLVRNESEARQAIDTLLTNDQEWHKRSLAGIRQVFAGHTYRHRLQYIFDQTGIDFNFQLEPTLLLTATAQTARDVERLCDFSVSQSWRGFTLLIQYVGDDHPTLSLPPGVKFAATLEDISLEFQDKFRQYHLAGGIDPYADYGTHYLQDLINAVRYAPHAHAWGKSVHGAQFAIDKPVYGYACIHLSERIADHPERLCSSGTIRGEHIYALDTDQFKPAAAESIMVVRP